MPYFIRKIDKAQWVKTNPETGDIAADAITNCLYTNKNSLSFWKVDDLNDETIINIIIAISSTFTSGLDTFDIVVLSADEVLENQELLQTPPTSPIVEMHENHYDLINLTLSRLGFVARLIYTQIADKKDMRFTRGRLKAIMRQFVIDKPDYKAKIHTSVTNSL
jgi:hypothetical protein